MKRFTKEEVIKLIEGTHEGIDYKEQKKILRGITGADGVFLYDVEPSFQKEMDEKASRWKKVTDKERWKSVEDARKAYAWHMFVKAMTDNVSC